MAGIVDAAYVLERAGHIGIAFIGGYSIDAPTMAAAKTLAAGGDRKEFLYEDPVKELKTQIANMEKSDVVLGINLRGNSPDSFSVSCKSPWRYGCLRDRRPLPAASHGCGRVRGILPEKPGQACCRSPGAERRGGHRFGKDSVSGLPGMTVPLQSPSGKPAPTSCISTSWTPARQNSGRSGTAAPS